MRNVLMAILAVMIMAGGVAAADITFPAYLATRPSATTPAGELDKLLILQGGLPKLISASGLESVVTGGTCSTSYTVNPANGGTVTLTLNGACSIGVTSLAAGQSFILHLTQSATTAPTFSSAFKWPGGVTPTWSTSASKYDTISCASPDGVKLICGAIIDAR